MKKIIPIFGILMLITMGIAFAASNLQLIESAKITTTSDGKIQVGLKIQNKGDSNSPTTVIEIDPRYGDLQPQALIYQQGTCDPKYPDNVHQAVFGVVPGEIINLNFVTPIMPPGKYQIYGVSVNQCCTLGSCNAVLPFYWQERLGEITVQSVATQACGNNICEGSETPGSCPSDCKGYCGDNFCSSAESSSSCPGDCGSSGGGSGTGSGGGTQGGTAKVEAISANAVAEGSKIKTQLEIQNTGTATASDFIVETQIKTGSCLFQTQAIVGTQGLCDSKHPQNMHRTISNLGPGEKAIVGFESPELPSGTYCAVALSVNKCFGDQAVAPYYWGQQVKTVTISGSTIKDECGDNKCTGKVNFFNCASDCTSYCGDGYFNQATETISKSDLTKTYCPGDKKGGLTSDNKTIVIGGIIGIAFFLFGTKKGRKFVFK